MSSSSNPMISTFATIKNDIFSNKKKANFIGLATHDGVFETRQARDIRNFYMNYDEDADTNDYCGHLAIYKHSKKGSSLAFCVSEETPKKNVKIIVLGRSRNPSASVMEKSPWMNDPTDKTLPLIKVGHDNYIPEFIASNSSTYVAKETLAIFPEVVDGDIVEEDFQRFFDFYNNEGLAMDQGVIAKQRGSAPKGTGKNTRKSKVAGFGKYCSAMMSDDPFEVDASPETLALLLLIAKNKNFSQFVVLKKRKKDGETTTRKMLDLTAIKASLKPTLDARLVEIEANKKVKKKTMAEKTADKVAEAVAVEKKKMEIALKDAEDVKIMEMANMFMDDFDLDEEETIEKLEKKYGELSEEVQQWFVERRGEE